MHHAVADRAPRVVFIVAEANILERAEAVGLLGIQLFPHREQVGSEIGQRVEGRRRRREVAVAETSRTP